jgi:hypothetical protein
MKIKSQKRIVANINVIIMNSFSIFGNFGKELENLDITHNALQKRGIFFQLYISYARVFFPTL